MKIIPLHMFTLMWVIVAGTSVQSNDDATGRYWTRLNYGFAAVKVKEVCVAEGYWHHVIHLSLPSIKVIGMPVPPPGAPKPGDSFSSHLRGLLNATQTMMFTMQQSVAQTIEKIFDLVPDATVAPDPRRGRRTRGLLDAIGYTSSYLFGIATTSDLNELKEMLKKIEAVAETEAADSARVREGMAQYTKLQNERMDNFRNILQAEHKTLGLLRQDFGEMAHAGTIESAALNYMIQELTRYIQIHDHLQLLELGIEDLAAGQLTPRLVEPGVLRNISDEVVNELNPKGFEPCYQHVKELYAINNFDVVRRGLELYIRLRIPYANIGHRQLSVYETQTFPLPVPGQQGVVSQLKDVPRYLLGNPDTLLIGEISEMPPFPVLDSKQVRWHLSRTTRTCVWALTADRADAIQEACNIVMRKQIIDSTYWEVAPGTYVISNLTGIRTKCPGQPSQIPTSKPCTPCLLQLNCNCQLFVSVPFTVLQPPKICDNVTTQTEIGHAVNLAILKSFYDLGNVTLTGSSLFKTSELPDHQPLSLTFFGDSTSKLWAADDSASYSLKRLTEGLKNDSVILHSPAEAIVHDLLTRNALLTTHKLTDWTFWVTIIPWVAIAVLTICQIRTNKRLSAITIASAIELTSIAPKARAFPLLTTPKVVILRDTHDLSNIMDHLRGIDWAFAVSLWITSIVLVVFGVWIHNTAARKSFLYLALTTEIDSVHLHFFTFPDASRNYLVKLPKGRATLILRSFKLFGILQFQTKPWRLVNTLSNEKLTLPTYTFIPPWKLAAIRQILCFPTYRLEPLIVHTHEYVRYAVTETTETTDPGLTPGHAESRH